MIKRNYHTHTYRCKHAEGDTVDYARAAAEAGLDVLGMSDHTPLPDNRWLHMRMDINELEDYIKSIEKAQQTLPQLTILKGMECEYLKEYHAFYEEDLLGKYKFDFLSASAHYYPYKGEWIFSWDGITGKSELAAYAEYTAQMISTGLFDYVAHPDMFGCSYDIWDADAKACSRYILEAAEEYQIPLEINAYGIRKGIIQTSGGERFMYPWEPFWKLASEYKVSVVVNSDAHRPKDITGSMDRALDIAGRYGLMLVESPDFCNRRKSNNSIYGRR